MICMVIFKKTSIFAKIFLFYFFNQRIKCFYYVIISAFIHVKFPIMYRIICFFFNFCRKDNKKSFCIIKIFPYFSFLKTRLVWYCLNLIVSAFQLELIPCFPLTFMSLSLNILSIYFWLCSLESPSISCPPCSFHTTPHDLFLPFS